MVVNSTQRMFYFSRSLYVGFCRRFCRRDGRYLVWFVQGGGLCVSISWWLSLGVWVVQLSVVRLQGNI